jgi:hypothetical protein
VKKQDKGVDEVMNRKDNQLSAISYQLSAISYQLSAIGRTDIFCL